MPVPALSSAKKTRPYSINHRDKAPGPPSDPQKALRDAQDGYTRMSIFVSPKGAGVPFPGGTIRGRLRSGRDCRPVRAWPSAPADS